MNFLGEFLGLPRGYEIGNPLEGGRRDMDIVVPVSTSYAKNGVLSNSASCLGSSMMSRRPGRSSPHMTQQPDNAPPSPTKQSTWQQAEYQAFHKGGMLSFLGGRVSSTGDFSARRGTTTVASISAPCGATLATGTRSWDDSCAGSCHSRQSWHLVWETHGWAQPPPDSRRRPCSSGQQCWQDDWSQQPHYPCHAARR